MREKRAFAPSPGVQEYMADDTGGDEVTAKFEEAFTQVAYDLLNRKIPYISAKVITFKIINIDVDTGHGVGAFVSQVGNHTLYIPAVISDGQLKPLELLYIKVADRFVPLNLGWLETVIQDSDDVMGDSATMPKGVAADVDLQNLMLPPDAGRYSYASDKSFLSYLGRVDNATRAKFASTLEENKALLKYAYHIYKDELFEALRPVKETEKVAGARDCFTFFDNLDSPGAIKEAFGSRTKEAVQQITSRGYAVVDHREKVAEAVTTESEIKLTEVKDPGVYKIFSNEGKALFALVAKTHDGGNREAFMLTSDGQWCDSFDLDIIGECDKDEENVSKVLGKAVNPNVGKYGVFIRKTGESYSAVGPFYLKTKKNGKDDTVSIGASYGKDGDPVHTLLIDSSGKVKKFIHQDGTPIIHIPADATFHIVDDKKRFYAYHKKFVQSPEALRKLYEYTIVTAGGEKVAALNLAGEDYKIITPRGYVTAHGRTDFIKKAALACNISTANAEHFYDKLANRRQTDFYTINDAGLRKVAQALDPLNAAHTALGAAQNAINAAQYALESVAPAGEAGAPMDPGMGDPGMMDPGMQGGQPPMDPAMMQGGGQPPMDPAMMQGGGQMPMDPGMMDPGMAGGQMPMDPGMMDPNMMQGGMPMEEGLPGTTTEQHQNINPHMMEMAEGLGDEDLFDTSAIASLAAANSVHEIAGEYIPVLERALDRLGRVILQLWMREVDLKEDLGDTEYTNVETNARRLFKELGEFVLKLNKNNSVLTQGVYDSPVR